MRKKRVFIVFLVCFLVLFGFQTYRKIEKMKKPAKTPAQVAIPVEIAPVEKTDISLVRQFSGSLEPRYQFVVAPKVAGFLEKLFVNTGDIIERNQIVALLDRQEYVQSVEQAKAELDVAKANLLECETLLENARKELERAKTLREKKIIPQAELDSAEANHKALESRYKLAIAQVEQKRAALRAAEIRLSYTQVRANWEGGSRYRVVGEKYVDEGAMLQPKEPIVSVVEMDTLLAVLYVAEEDYAKLKKSQKVTITTDIYPDRTFEGKIYRISPVIKESSRSGRVEVLVENPEHLLKPGGFVRAEIEMEKHKNTNVVPISALTKREGKQGVFLVDIEKKQVRFVPCETGIINETQAEIISPQIQGYVVTIGQHMLVDGTRITIPALEKSSSEGKTFPRKNKEETKK